MPDAQTLNSVFKAYGISDPMSTGGGINWINILGGIVFGIIGWSAFMYGKKEKNYRPIVLGIGLMIFPYFVPNPILFFVIGFGLTAGLFLWKE